MYAFICVLYVYICIYIGHSSNSLFIILFLLCFMPKPRWSKVIVQCLLGWSLMLRRVFSAGSGGASRTVLDKSSSSSSSTMNTRALHEVGRDKNLNPNPYAAINSGKTSRGDMYPVYHGYVIGEAAAFSLLEAEVIGYKTSTLFYSTELNDSMTLYWPRVLLMKRTLLSRDAYPFGTMYNIIPPRMPMSMLSIVLERVMLALPL